MTVTKAECPQGLGGLPAVWEAWMALLSLAPQWSELTGGKAPLLCFRSAGLCPGELGGGPEAGSPHSSAVDAMTSGRGC